VSSRAIVHIADYGETGNVFRRGQILIDRNISALIELGLAAKESTRTIEASLSAIEEIKNDLRAKYGCVDREQFKIKED
jgi:hypothetical protein